MNMKLWITLSCLASLATLTLGTILDTVETEDERLITRDRFFSPSFAWAGNGNSVTEDGIQVSTLARSTWPSEATEVTTYHPSFNALLKKSESESVQALAIPRLVPSQIQYSAIRNGSSPEYHRPPRWNARGMEHVYKVVTYFIHLIQPGRAVPKGVQVGESLEQLVKEFTDKWPFLLDYYKGIAIVGALGVILAVILPIVGFFFCCCRCCGKCGATTDPFDKKRDPCKRAGLGIILGTILVLVTFGVICAFVSNVNVDEGVLNFPSQLENSASDIVTFMNATRSDYHHLLVTNYQELETELNRALQESGRVLLRELGRVSKALSIENLTSIASSLSDVRQDLESVASDTQLLEQNANQLQLSLAHVRTELKKLLDQCKSMKACADFQAAHSEHVELLAVNLPFQGLPVVGNMARNISKLISQGIESEVRKGEQELRDLSERANSAIMRQIPQVSQHLRQNGVQLENVVGNLSQITKQGMDVLQSPQMSSSINTMRTYIDTYEFYRFYVGIGISAMILFILMCFCLGLMFGCCCKRPAEYGEDECGTKATGASCLMTGVYVFYLTSWLLFLLVASHFLLGSISEKLTCEDPMTVNPHSSVNPIAGVLDRAVDLKSLFPQVFQDSGASFSSLLQNCNHNKTLYEALHLASVYNMTALKERVMAGVPVDDIVSRLIDGLNQAWDGNVVLLNSRAQAQLRELTESSLVHMNFTNHSLLLENQLTSMNLSSLAQDLESTASFVDTMDRSAAAERLRNVSRLLSNLQVTYMVPMGQLATKLRVTVNRLQDNVRFNHSSLQEAVSDLLNQVVNAEKYLRTEGRQQLEHLARDFAKEFVDALKVYADYVEFHVTSQLGRCGPLSQAYNSSSGALCEAVVKPFNGFWASVGWTLLLFLPCLALSVSLVKLYRKSDPYPGPLVEHVRDGGRRARHASEARAYDHSSNFAYYDGDSAANAFASGNGATPRSNFGGAVVAPSDRELKHPGRYQDMAPRAWDSNGAPRYTASPSLATPTRVSQVTVTTTTTAGSEYERPPPYYYPGPA